MRRIIPNHVTTLWLQCNVIDARGLRSLARGLLEMPDDARLSSMSLGENAFSPAFLGEVPRPEALARALEKLSRAAGRRARHATTQVVSVCRVGTGRYVCMCLLLQSVREWLSLSSECESSFDWWITTSPSAHALHACKGHICGRHTRPLRFTQTSRVSPRKRRALRVKKALDGSSSSRAMRRSSSSAATPRGAASPRGTGATPPSAGATSFRGSKDAQTPGSARGGGGRPMSSGSKASGTSPPTRTSRRVSSSPAAATDLDAHSYGASPAPASAAPGAAAAATLGKKRGGPEELGCVASRVSRKARFDAATADAIAQRWLQARRFQVPRRADAR